MAPNIKLTYFNIRGLAENIRLILAQVIFKMFGVHFKHQSYISNNRQELNMRTIALNLLTGRL